MSTPIEPAKPANSFIRYALAFLLPVVIILLGRMFVFDLYSIPTSSMESTLMTGDKIIALKVNASNPSTGDIVVFKDDQHWANGEILFVKRVIGMPGDKVSSDGEHVYLNGKILEEPYVLGDTLAFDEQVVPEGSFFMMGDNRENSADSRAHILDDKQFVSGDSLVAKYLIHAPF